MQMKDAVHAKLVADGHVPGVPLSKCPACQRSIQESYLSSPKEQKRVSPLSSSEELGAELAVVRLILLWFLLSVAAGLFLT